MTTKTAYLLLPRTQGMGVRRLELDPEHDLHFEKLAKLVECEWVEHVVVLLDGNRVHMFVDEMGHQKPARAGDLNARATALYHNVTLNREGAPRLNGRKILDQDGEGFDLHFAPGVPMIVGPALVWPHAALGWEPEDRPWAEYEV